MNTFDLMIEVWKIIPAWILIALGIIGLYWSLSLVNGWWLFIPHRYSHKKVDEGD